MTTAYYTVFSTITNAYVFFYLKIKKNRRFVSNKIEQATSHMILTAALFSTH